MMLIIIKRLLSAPRRIPSSCVRSVGGAGETVYLLALRVQGGGGLVQEQDLGVADDRPGDGDALLLTAGQLGALCAHVGVVFLGKGEAASSDTTKHKQDTFSVPSSTLLTGFSHLCLRLCDLFNPPGAANTKQPRAKRSG